MSEKLIMQLLRNEKKKKTTRELNKKYFIVGHTYTSESTKPNDIENFASVHLGLRLNRWLANFNSYSTNTVEYQT